LGRDLSQGRMGEPIRGALAEVLERRFLVDELYAAVFVGLGGRLGRGLARFDAAVVDGAVRGAGAGAVVLGDRVRRAQSGRTRTYLAVMVVGTALVVVALLMAR
ncbi:MAG: hypothetical protein RLZZ272_1779, partial [Actinomycetota bacterium]